jgi:hypothetical protein
MGRSPTDRLTNASNLHNGTEDEGAKRDLEKHLGFPLLLALSVLLLTLVTFSNLGFLILASQPFGQRPQLLTIKYREIDSAEKPRWTGCRTNR